MKTIHKIYYNNAINMDNLDDESVDLVITSPPYPMIEMWDEIFTKQNHKIAHSIKNHNGQMAFEMMHNELDKVWDELFRVLKNGGIICINIGDATRTINGHFALYTNHSRIQSHMLALGFTALPIILWRKQTNAPNKFMGSGMMPPGAYVTLEHEYILIFRKGNKKEFTSEKEKANRRESSFFWEERNLWFSDVWMDLKGTSQNLFDSRTRNRSAAYPFELPYRLITMFSVKNDTVLDPFFGVGTTMYAAISTCRNSVGYEIDKSLKDAVESRVYGIVKFANKRIHQRLKDHTIFVENHFQKKGKFKYFNKHYLFPVVTNQETELLINNLVSVEKVYNNSFAATYSRSPQDEFVGFWEGYVLTGNEKMEMKLHKRKKNKSGKTQIGLFE